MIILVIGKSYSAKRVSEYLSQDKNNVIFTTADTEFANKIDISPLETDELKDFILANEVNFLIVADKNYFGINYNELLCDTECVCFYPDCQGAKLATNIITGKKFAYKNKIQTPKFNVFDKYQSFLDFIKTSNLPISIIPEFQTDKETTYIAETKDNAKKYAEKLFETGNKRIITEEYINGIEYTQYILLNGGNYIDAINAVSYFDEISTNNTNFIKDDIKKEVREEIIPNIINGLLEDGIDYTGILGISFKINKEKIYFSNFKPFFEDIDIDIFLNSTEENLAELLYNFTVKNTDVKNINLNNKYIICLDNRGNYITSFGNTFKRAIEFLEYENIDKDILNEALSHWKN